ncbi:MAG: DUF58 domain-containing protein [Rhodothermia bacterium]
MVYTDLASLVRLQHEARDFSFLPRQPVHSILSGKHASRLRGRGMDFEEVRHYAPGDDVRTIDWKVTARTRAPHTKVYNEERERPVLLIVDQSSSMFFGSQVSMKSVTAAEVAALGAWRVLSQGDRVGGIVFGSDSVVETKPRRSRKTVVEFLQSLVTMNAKLEAGLQRGGGLLNTALHRAARLAHHDFLIVPVSDFSQTDDETVKLLVKMSQHNDVLAVHVSDPMEKTLPVGRIVISDGHRQITADGSQADLRDRYSNDFEQRLTDLEDRFRRYRIPVLKLDTVRPIGRQTRDQLGHRLTSRRVR